MFTNLFNNIIFSNISFERISLTKFCKYYINNIVIFLRNIIEHLTHFKIIFVLFIQIKISLKFKKLYVKYLFIMLLRQRIDNLDF